MACRYLHLLAFRDVGDDAREAHQTARSISDLKSPGLHPANCAVGARDPILHTRSRLVFHQSGEDAEDALSVIRNDALGPLTRIGVQFFRRTAPNPLVAGADVVDFL